jgi:RNA polymerase sigma factor (sigma-70 family)
MVPSPPQTPSRPSPWPVPERGPEPIGPEGGPGDGPATGPDGPVDDREDRLAALLEKARGGAREYLDEIVAELTPLLWHVVRAQGVDREAAEDVIQTTWLRLLNHLDRIQTPRALAGWLVTVAKREAWHVRGRSRAAVPLAEDAVTQVVADPQVSPDEQVIADERRRVLWAAVNKLERRCQELLRIVAFAPAASYATVAGALGMPVGSIGPTRGRCLAKLRTLLATEPAWSPR